MKIENVPIIFPTENDFFAIDNTAQFMVDLVKAIDENEEYKKTFETEEKLAMSIFQDLMSLCYKVKALNPIYERLG